MLNIVPLPRSRQNHIFQAYSQADNVLSYDVYYGIWSICTNEVLMVDFDVKLGFTKLDAVDLLKKFTNDWKAKGVEYLFWIYETDRGVHGISGEQKSAIRQLVKRKNTGVVGVTI